MAKIKHKARQRFTVINNAIYEDKRLKLGDIGLFDFLFHFPDDWTFREVDLAKRTASKRTSLRTSLKRLEKFGYVKRERERNEKGQLVSVNWILDDQGKLGDNSKINKNRSPAKKKPLSENQTTDKNEQKQMSETPTSEKQMLEKQKSGIDRLLNTNSTKYLVGSSKHASKASQTDEQILAKNQSEHSLDDPNGVSKAYNLWNDTWGKPSEFVEKQISQWVNEFGIDVVAHAINYAKWKVEQTSKAGSYLAKVFDNYRQSNVQTASQAAEADAMNLHRSKLSQRAKQSDSTTTPSKGKSSRKDDLKNLIKDEPEAICYRAARLAKINLSGADQQALNEFVRRLGPKLVLNAIEVAKQETRYQYPSWGFLRSILRRYEAQGIKTVEDVKSDDSNMPSKGNSKQYKRHKPIKEPMPEWSRKSKEELYKKADPEAICKLKERIANRDKGRKEASG